MSPSCPQTVTIGESGVGRADILTNGEEHVKDGFGRWVDWIARRREREEG